MTDLLIASKRLRFSLALALALTLAAGCIVRHDSPAPGCIEYWGMAPSGGCAGRTVIQALEVRPAVDCLEIQINNCNGGILEVTNNCPEPLVLGGVDIAARQRYVGLDVLEAVGDSFLLTHAAGNFSTYLPAADEQILVYGSVGDQMIEVRYTKTADLCPSKGE